MRSLCLIATSVLLLTLPNASGAQNTTNHITKKMALSKIGTGQKLSWFAFTSKMPATWATDSYSAMSDPPWLKRLVVENRAAPTMRMLGKMNYFKHHISLELWLKKPSNLNTVLDSWMKNVLRQRVISGVNAQWPVVWQRNMVQTATLSGGRTLMVRMMVGAARPSPYVQPMAVQLIGLLLIDGPRVAAMGTGLSTDNTYGLLSPSGKKSVLTTFQVLYQQLMAVGALGHITMPGRDKSTERSLRRKKRFVHAARSQSSIGTFSKTSYSAMRLFVVKFKGSKCTIKSDFSNIYASVQRSIFDPPGTIPSTTNAGSGAKQYTAPAPFEVRRRGGERWLLVYHQKMPAFYPVALAKSRRCSKKTVRGMAINGLVEGIYSTFRGWCIYKRASGLRL